MKATEDEQGIQWHVLAGDPASKLVNKLVRKGFTYIVLPRYTLKTGELTDVPTCGDYLRSVRLSDCVKVLSDN
jgi:hypothetical protein